MPKRIRRHAFHSAPSEFVRRLRSATRDNDMAREETAKYARVLGALRSAGLPIDKDGSIYRRYHEARSRLEITRHLLILLNEEYRKRYGKRFHQPKPSLYPRYEGEAD